MRLYHYTHRQGATGIFETGYIHTGKAPALDGVAEKFGVSLTTDPSRLGHGLPDGRVITQAQAKVLRGYTKGEGVMRCVDHTKYRLCLEIDDRDPNLLSFLKLFEKHPEFVLAVDISAHWPTDAAVTDEQLNEAVALFGCNPKLRKSPTWWFYLKDIPISSIIEVGVWDEKQYLVCHPTEFIGYLAETAKPN